jgi:hypothetical protein
MVANGVVGGRLLLRPRMVTSPSACRRPEGTAGLGCSTGPAVAPVDAGFSRRPHGDRSGHLTAPHRRSVHPAVALLQDPRSSGIAGRVLDGFGQLGQDHQPGAVQHPRRGSAPAPGRTQASVANQLPRRRLGRSVLALVAPSTARIWPSFGFGRRGGGWVSWTTPGEGRRGPMDANQTLAERFEELGSGCGAEGPIRRRGACPASTSTALSDRFAPAGWLELMLTLAGSRPRCHREPAARRDLDSRAWS